MDDTMKEELAKVGELLQKVGPSNMLGVMGIFSGELAAQARSHGDVSAAEMWHASSESLQRFSAILAAGGEPPAASVAQGGTSEDDNDDPEEEEDGLNEDDDELDATEGMDGAAVPIATAAAPPHVEEPRAAESDGAERKEDTSAAGAGKDRIKMKFVAGIQVKDSVKRCRLRSVSEAGDRGELLGRANEHGMEENEWRVELITPHRLREWFGPGRYMFEWFGDDGKGASVALGRSRPFRIFDGETKNAPAVSRMASAPAAPVPATPNAASFDQTFMMLRYFDEKNEREKEREREDRRFREEMASKERIARMQAQAKMAETQVRATREAADEPEDALDEDSLLAKMDALVSQKLAAVAPKATESDDLPGWAKALGLKELIEFVKPQLPGLLAKLTVPAVPPAPVENTNPYPVRTFRPKTAAEG